MRTARCNFGRVLLVNSNNHDFEPAMPLGLMSIATHLEAKHRLECTITDLPQEEKGHDDIIKDFVTTLDLSEFLFVGLSTMCNTYPRTLSIAQSIKKNNASIPIVLGGPQATASAIATLRSYAFIDCIVVGEAEAILDDLIRQLKTGKRSSIPGILWRADSKSVACALHAPLALIDAIPTIRYGTYPQALCDKGVMVDVGRGCPFACTFCSTNDFFKRRYRLKTPELIVKDLRQILVERKVKRVDFVHDMFTANRKLVEGLCERLVKSDIQVHWSCSARTDTVDLPLLQRMRAAGCDDIFFGIETGSKRMHRVINKQLDLDDAVKTMQTACDLGFRVTASLIIGFPQEVVDDLAATINLALRLRSRTPQLKSVQIHMMSPLTGTGLTNEFFEKMEYDGFITDITSVNCLSSWEEKEITTRRDLFSSFYYFPNKQISRDTYKFLYWVLHHGVRFEVFFRLLWEQMKQSCGIALIDWAVKEGAELFESLDHQDPEYSVPALASKLNEFVLSCQFDTAKTDQFLDAIRFDLWRSFLAEAQGEAMYVSRYDYLSPSSELCGFDERFIYGLDLNRRRLHRTCVKADWVDHFLN